MAMLNRWDPWRELARVQDEVNRVLGDGNVRSAESVGWTPAADVFEDEEGLTLSFDLAGVDPKEVEIRFENGTLTLRGERKLAQEDRKENYHRVERAYGSFTRAFSLPATVDAERIQASSKHGVLTVTLPKRSEAKPKSIQVKVD